MHIDEIDKKVEEVIARAERNESLPGDDRIINGCRVLSGNIGRRIEFARLSKLVYPITQLNGHPVSDAGKILGKIGAKAKHANALAA